MLPPGTQTLDTFFKRGSTSTSTAVQANQRLEVELPKAQNGSLKPSLKRVRPNDEDQNEENKTEVQIKLKVGEAHSRPFQDNWLDKFFWLSYNKEDNIMYCKLCIKHGKSNAMTKGSTRFKIDALYEHTITEDHCQAYDD